MSDTTDTIEIELYDLSLYEITKFYLYSYIELGIFIKERCCPCF